MNLELTAEKLAQNGFQVKVFKTAGEARAAVVNLIPTGAKVGIGGSMTIFSMGLHETLAEEGRTVHWHWLMPVDKREAAQEAAHKADFYLSSANSVLSSGELVYIDGKSNRTGTILYGPKNIIIIAGRNKISETFEKGIERIKGNACPKNARRLGLATPCAELGRCTDCRSPQRMCNATVRISRAIPGRNFYVFLVDEDLGF